jgi:hypothetical protein
VSEPVPVTRDLLDAGRSDKGGWSAAQLALLGVNWPPLKGWGQSVLGKLLSPEDAQKFIALRNARSIVSPPTGDLFS